MLPSAAQQFQLEVASSLVSPRVDSHVCDPKDGPGYHLSIRGRWLAERPADMTEHLPLDGRW